MYKMTRSSCGPIPRRAAVSCNTVSVKFAGRRILATVRLLSWMSHVWGSQFHLHQGKSGILFCVAFALRKRPLSRVFLFGQLIGLISIRYCMTDRRVLTSTQMFATWLSQGFLDPNLHSVRRPFFNTVTLGDRKILPFMRSTGYSRFFGLGLYDIARLDSALLEVRRLRSARSDLAHATA